MKLIIPNSRKLWRMRNQHKIHKKNEFPNAFSVWEASRIRNLIGESLVLFFEKLKEK